MGDCFPSRVDSTNVGSLVDLATPGNSRVVCDMTPHGEVQGTTPHGEVQGTTGDHLQLLGIQEAQEEQPTAVQPEPGPENNAVCEC
ncbi:LOW QUALITY PROTEIN: hypothetical protein U0070_023799 [Myodes glareolus]|uniref:Uncharacterized protein n=1 Tax=Myodes glareolus TaxID=447135 RepID=A0AAW0HTG6_MYOGA